MPRGHDGEPKPREVYEEADRARCFMEYDAARSAKEPAERERLTMAWVDFWGDALVNRLRPGKPL